jgi:hypothetical protein
MVTKPVVRRGQDQSPAKCSGPAKKGSRKPNGAENGAVTASLPRWILYHGTSTARLAHILSENRLRMSGGAFDRDVLGAGGQKRVVANPAATPKFTPGMIVKFTKYPDGETGGIFTPGEEVYIHSIQPVLKGDMVKIYICTKASDAEAAKADPNLDTVQAEELAHSQLRIKIDPDPRDPMSAYVTTSATSDPILALTTERSVAVYWACRAALADRRDRPEEESKPVVLVLNGERLLEEDHPLGEFDNHFWDDEEDDVNYGIACLQDIDPLEAVLIATEPVTTQLYDCLAEQSRETVWHPAPPLARVELLVMSDTIGRLVDGDIAPAEADAVVSALGSLRSAMSQVIERKLAEGWASMVQMRHESAQ